MTFFFYPDQSGRTQWLRIRDLLDNLLHSKGVLLLYHTTHHVIGNTIANNQQLPVANHFHCFAIGIRTNKVCCRSRGERNGEFVALIGPSEGILLDIVNDSVLDE